MAEETPVDPKQLGLDETSIKPSKFGGEGKGYEFQADQLPKGDKDKLFSPFLRQVKLDPDNRPNGRPAGPIHIAPERYGTTPENYSLAYFFALWNKMSPEEQAVFLKKIVENTSQQTISEPIKLARLNVAKPEATPYDFQIKTFVDGMRAKIDQLTPEAAKKIHELLTKWKMLKDDKSNGDEGKEVKLELIKNQLKTYELEASVENNFPSPLNRLGTDFKKPGDRN